MICTVDSCWIDMCVVSYDCWLTYLQWYVWEALNLWESFLLMCNAWTCSWSSINTVCWPKNSLGVWVYSLFIHPSNGSLNHPHFNKKKKSHVISVVVWILYYLLRYCFASRLQQKSWYREIWRYQIRLVLCDTITCHFCVIVF